MGPYLVRTPNKVSLEKNKVEKPKIGLWAVPIDKTPLICRAGRDGYIPLPIR